MGVQRRVVVSGIIGFDGKAEPSSVQVVHRVDPDLDREAIRYVRAAAFSPACVAAGQSECMYQSPWNSDLAVDELSRAA